MPSETITQKAIAIIYDPSRCTGCHMCELACSLYHFHKSHIELSRVIVYKDKASAMFIPSVCISCPAMPCASVCPENAIVKDEKTGMPKVIEEKCLGEECGKCVEACPYHAIRFSPKVYPYPLICDLCGGDPQCVKVCWARALEIVERTKDSDTKRYLIAAEVHRRINEIFEKYGGE